MPAACLSILKSADAMNNFDPAPVHLQTVISPDWLTAMLALRWPGARVIGVETVEVLATQATKVRVKLDVTGGGTDVP
jgi:hypothetical protein